MTKVDLKHLRIDFSNEVLRKSDLAQNPLDQFTAWVKQSTEAGVPENNAFVLSTAKDGIVNSRVVLLKLILDDGIVFFTNYNSQKGIEIENNNNVSANFLWKQMHRQIRIQGRCEKVSEQISEEYFQSRPIKSRISAIISDQSKVIDNRQTLEAQWEEAMERIGTDTVRPRHWGGFIIKPTTMEFWQGQQSRLHDRFQYIQESNGSRLAP